MKSLKSTLPLLFITALSVVFGASCSSEKNTLTSKAFHNTTAHFNAYYYSKENIKAIERIIDESIQNDYDYILPIFPSIDTTLAGTYKNEIEEAIKMASLAIQRHPNSHWVDDSYNLVGLARLYDLDYVNAILTFKWVNTNSQNKDTRHLALIYLLKTFTDHEEFDNALQVSDYLNKEKLSTANQKLLYLYRAYYYQVRGDLDNMLKNMVAAAPILSNKDGKGRIYFIIGQNYQALGFDSEAYSYYKKCLATNPEYELDFYARLKMAQVTQLARNSDIKEVRKHFKKLLKDKKNKEFKDKIYYEMARFEARNGNTDDAIGYYNSSIRSFIKNKKQQGLAYLRLGEIYYDTLRNYELAQAYYDSAIIALPKDYEDYESIKSRQLILTDFVAQLNIIEEQDSLLQLSAMDTADLRKYFTTYLEEKAALEEAKRKTQARSRSASVLDKADDTGTSKWYFGNPTAVAMGQTEFIRVWGDVPLEDNWRRSVKDNSNTDIADNSGKPPLVSANGNETSHEDQKANQETAIKQLMGNVPRTAQEKQEALAKIEEAYYKLGNIYYFDLKESLNAAETYEILLDRFSETDYKVEVLYLLYLIYQDANDERYLAYKNQILNDFSNSTYAKLIINPNYTQESSVASEKLKIEYKKAYEHYRKGELTEAKIIINDALSQYDDLPISDRFKLLSVLITGKTEDIARYQYELSQFVENNPESEFAPYAQTLLAASRDFQTQQTIARGVKYVEYFEQEHYLIIVYSNKSKLSDKINTTLENFNKNGYSELNLVISRLILNDEYSLTMVSEFAGAKSSLVYFERLMLDPTINSALPLADLDIFTITTDNFSIFYQTKELRKYLQFFKEHYQ